MVAAYGLYTEALGIDKLNKYTNAKLYCNRALVGSKVSHREPNFRGVKHLMLGQ